ncbi:MAG: protein-disulfide reductase DsbD domain-containing protein, partial [Alphaproteobacteria bacterium]
MRLRCLVLLILCLCGLVANTVKVQLLAPENHSKQKIPFVLVFELPEHSHIYGPDDVDSPTILNWKLPKGMEIEFLKWPPLQNLNLQGHVYKGYEGKIYVCGSIAIENDALKKLSSQDIQVEVSYIVCEKLCNPEKTVQNIKFVDFATWNDLPKLCKSLNFFTFNTLLMFVFALIGGALLNLMPCVLPILSLKVMTIAQHAHSKKLKTSALFFTAGTLLSFWVLAGLLLAFRAAGHQVGWGFQLQSPTVVT